MKPAVAFALISASLVAPAFAQSHAPANVPPPPSITDPGTQARPATAATSLLPTKPAPIVSGQPLPEVSVRRQGDDTVQEYRRNGQLYMVVVTPKNGVAQTYMVDPQGRLVDDHGQKPTRPVMYKILEWGKSKPAPAASASGDGD